MQKKLKVGLFIDTFFPMIDGVVVVVNNYAKILSKTCDVTVFAPKGRTPYDDSKLPYKVVRCSKLRLFNLDYDLPTPKFDRKFLKELKRTELDIVHIHSPFSVGKIGVKYAKKHNIPCIGTMHSQYKKEFLLKTHNNKTITNFLLKSIMSVYNKCDLVLTMNNASIALLKEYGYKGKSEIVSNATELIYDEKINKQSLLLKKQHKINNEKILLSLGRVIKLKNIEFIIDVCNVLKEKKFAFKLLIMGTGVDLNYFKQRVEKLCLKNEIIFVPASADAFIKSAYLNLCHLSVFPSLCDTDGIVRIEAACFEKPTIFMEKSFASSVCTDEVNGYIGENNIEKFADKIIKIFKDEEKYHKVCKQVKKDMYVTWKDIINQVLKIYDQQINLKQKEIETNLIKKNKK